MKWSFQMLYNHFTFSLISAALSVYVPLHFGQVLGFHLFSSWGEGPFSADWFPVAPICDEQEMKKAW